MTAFPSHLSGDGVFVRAGALSDGSAIHVILYPPHIPALIHHAHDSPSFLDCGALLKFPFHEAADKPARRGTVLAEPVEFGFEFSRKLNVEGVVLCRAFTFLRMVDTLFCERVAGPVMR